MGGGKPAARSAALGAAVGAVAGWRRSGRVGVAWPRLAWTLLLGVAWLGGCREARFESAEDRSGSEAASEALAPAPAPAFEATTLGGDSVALAELEGEVVLLNVWATWCVPCRQEVPELQALHEAYAGDGLRVIGVTVDHRGARDQIERFMEEFGMTYDVWWDPDQSAVAEFEAIGVPLTVLIDREGRIVWRHLGAFERGDPDLIEAVATALGTRGAGATGAEL